MRKSVSKTETETDSVRENPCYLACVIYDFDVGCAWCLGVDTFKCFSFMNYRPLSNMQECRIIHCVWIIYNSATISGNQKRHSIQRAQSGQQFIPIEIENQCLVSTKSKTHDSRYFNGRRSVFSKWLNPNSVPLIELSDTSSAFNCKRSF